MEKVLVVILSQTRAHELCFDSFQRNLLSQFEMADLALCVTDLDVDGDPGENQFYAFAKYIWKYPEGNDWRESYQDLVDKYGIIENWDKFLRKRGNWLGGIRNTDGQQVGSGAILLYMRLFLLECLIENNLADQYDYFIVTRSDFIWTCPHPGFDMLGSEMIWIPSGEGYNGITDRHICFSKKHLHVVLTPLLFAFKTNPECFSMMDDEEWNIERFLYFSYVQQGIGDCLRFFPYCMYLVKRDETHTRWSSGAHSIIHNYLIKYILEYKSANVWKFLIRSQKDWQSYPEHFSRHLRHYPDNTPLKRGSIFLRIYDRVINRTFGDSYLVTRVCRLVKQYLK